MLPKITLYYDVVSPYSWIAFETLLRYQQKKYFDLTLKPFFLGGVMKATSNRAPAMVAAKGAHLVKDLDFSSKYYGMNIVHPKDFFEMAIKNGTLQTQRFLVALQKEKEEYLIPASREFWTRLWSKQETGHSIDDIIAVGKKIGLSEDLIKKLIEKTSSFEVKDLIKKNTDEAINDGAFGAPWIKVEREDGQSHSFFGSDRMPQICYFIDKPFIGSLASNEIKSKI
uniref:Glutathione S-transferase kappa n=1 Tax=Parastrongyloides trichosuri TaxID=131310 RepID=A0A0N4ZUE3_PARTI